MRITRSTRLERLSVGFLAAVFGAAALASTATVPCPEDLHPAVQKLRAFAATRTFHWDSKLTLDGTPLVATIPSIARARWALGAVLNPKGELVAGFQQETGLGNDLQDPRFWDLYMRSYDLLGFSAGYTDLLFRFSAELPSEGDILDLGGGTGNFPAFGLHDFPKRKATVVDKQGVGLAIAREKLAAFGYAPERWRVVAGDITDPTAYPHGPYAAAMLNNVLYTLPRDQKIAVLRTALSHVPAGAPILVGEPLPQDLRATVAFFDKNMVSALETGAPFSDHSMLAMLAVNAIILKAPVPRHFTGPDDTIAMGKEAGLEFVRWEPSYFDGAGFYVFRKPK